MRQNVFHEKPEGFPLFIPTHKEKKNKNRINAAVISWSLACCTFQINPSFFSFFTGIRLLTFFVDLISRQKRGRLLLIGFWLFFVLTFFLCYYWESLNLFMYLMMMMMFRKCTDKSSVWRLWPNNLSFGCFTFTGRPTTTTTNLHHILTGRLTHRLLRSMEKQTTFWPASHQICSMSAVSD